ncbi:YaaW family protein [Leptolyngbya ohadii]|uniref:YaaW family protein n=1 Tax=Leptolyngbya ohadii TaxID=1962290 RepID=UPI000B59C80C|nr:YaaW family protein [Leptolyngbya ohadii]
MDELRIPLELASDEELQLLTDILFRRRFNPLDYVCTPQPIEVCSQSREEQIEAIEERFRFLAADGVTVLRRRSSDVSYRQILVRVCRYLKLPYAQSMTTEDLEAEIFLHLLHRAWENLPASEKRVLNGKIQQVVNESHLAQQLPKSPHTDPVGLLLKGGSALAVSSVLRPWLLQVLAKQFAIHWATYQVAREAIVQGGTAVAAQVQNQAALQIASRGMALNAARYGAARSLLAFVGPALWMWFFADLGWRTVATNYGRVIPVIFTLAQIRLTRMADFQPA